MKKTIFLVSLVFIFMSSIFASDQLSLEDQQQIIDNYMRATHQHSQMSTAMDEDQTIKCGTPALLDFRHNYDKLDKSLLKASGLQLATRPVALDQTHISPSGFFKIHYTNTGSRAVRNDIPGYIDSIGLIFDEVHSYMFDTLGYPLPPNDGAYLGGGDDKFDIYLIDLGPGYYGLTFVDSAFYDGANSIRATAFMELDNDYSALLGYDDRPLDAIRVTAAHEFFHVVQFGIDFTEAEVDSSGFRSYWMEMSATWMEEEIYDDINDYYSYIPFFFTNPAISIQQFKPVNDFHPYASVLFSIYLSERYHSDLIKDIWLLCGSMGAGANFLQATDSVIKLHTTDVENLATSFSEFALWNYFTGSRSGKAPSGVGYSERLYYIDEFDDDPVTGFIEYHDNYTDPLQVNANENPYNPQHTSAFYMKLAGFKAVDYDTTYWACNVGAPTSCTDSTQLLDGSTGFDFIHVDSIFKMQIGLDPTYGYYWGLSLVYQIAGHPDSIIIDRMLLPPGGATAIGMDIVDPKQYESVVMIFTPASPFKNYYNLFTRFGVAYRILENSSLFIDCPTGITEYDLIEYEDICTDLQVLASPDSVLTSYGTYEDGTLCFAPDTAGLYTIDIEAVKDDTVFVYCTAQYRVTMEELVLMYPYPNPAVVREMTSDEIHFNLTMPDQLYTGQAVNDPYLVVDIYSIGGDHVQTLELTNSGSFVPGQIFDVGWDMTNSSGKDVASGAYIVYARFYLSQASNEIISEYKTKVAIIR